MNYRRYALPVAVLALVLVNVWHWWPAASSAPRAAQPSANGRTSPESLLIKVSMDAGKTARLRRDPFQPRIRTVAVAPTPVVTPPPTPPPKTPEQLAEETARAELAQIKLVGIVFRGNKGQAFLVKGDQVYLGHVGEKVGERFTIEAVNAENVVLKDPTTNISGQLSVSGK